MTAVQLAWRNLLHERVRTLISLAGVSFAVVLIFMQLGFLGAVESTATQFYDVLDFDLVVVSSEYLDLNRPADFPRARLAQARGVAGVEAVTPLSAGIGLWRDPRPSSPARRRWSILMLGVEPASMDRAFVHSAGVLGDAQAAARGRTSLSRLDTVLLDRSSWPEYGGPDERRPGSRGELNDRQVEVVGDVAIGTGFGYNGLLLTNEESFARLTGRPAGRVNFGLVRLAPGTDLLTARAALERALPHEDVRVRTREELNDAEKRFWVNSTAVGRFFTLAVFVALVVGVVFVYQIMSGDIRNHLPEYATVKALGYRGSYLTRVILAQAVLLAFVGYLPGLLGALGFYALTRQAARIPIGMNAGRATFVLALTVAMCLCSGMLAVRKVHSAEPADLF